LALPGVAAAGLAQLARAEAQSEHPVDGMRGGNLSGLACAAGLWAVSDRDDDRSTASTSDSTWRAEALVHPAAGAGHRPAVGAASRNWAASFIRGGDLDFEGITCDRPATLHRQRSHAAVLQVPPRASRTG
jgi:hypothetical protein